jgi:hypothetical protein
MAGVLKSLRIGHHYAHLSDHGEALRLALTDGVSRFGPQNAVEISVPYSSGLRI